MGQMGFFDLRQRYEGLDAKNDPLVKLNTSVPWERFRGKLEAALVTAGTRKAAEERKSNAGRPPWDAVLMFKVLVLAALYNLSDEQMEYLLRDRLSFMRFLGLGLEDLFDAFDGYLKEKGYLAMGGQIVDASIVSAPKQRNSREENEAVKAGKTPEAWATKPAKNAQKDKDARWTKKHGRSYYGYKNHVDVDRRHKLVRRYAVTDAARHDSQEMDGLLDESNTASDVWADSAYRSKETEEKLEAAGFKSRIHCRATRAKPLGERQKQANTTRSRVRARVEHVFGHQENSMGGKIVRTIGLVRAKAKIGMMNLVYNMSRLMQLERMAAVPT